MDKEKLLDGIQSLGMKKIILLFLLGVCLLLLSFPSEKKSEKEKQVQTNTAEDDEERYAQKQEKRLTEALRHVEGVGKVRVMITLKASSEAVLNKDSPYEESTGKEEKTIKEGEETILMEEDGKKVPYVIKKVEPEVEGVIVVAGGGGNEIIRQNIVEAVSVLFHISSYKVKVLKMEDS